MIEDILVFGIGGHSKVVIDAIRQQNKYRIQSFLSLENLTSYLSIPHVHQDQLDSLSCNKGVVAIGDNYVRKNVVDKILKIKPNFEFVNIIHPAATVADNVMLGQGVVVFANAVINADAIIGSHVIINTSSSVDHECIIGDFSSIAPGVVLGGNVKIGIGSAVALGAKILHSIVIGQNTVIGAGSLVTKDVSDNVLAYGVPCRLVRSRESGDRYL